MAHGLPRTRCAPAANQAAPRASRSAPLPERRHAPAAASPACRHPTLTRLLARSRSRADDFDLPITDLDDDTDEARAAVPKRKDDEKWGELCLDELNSGRSRPATMGLH